MLRYRSFYTSSHKQIILGEKKEKFTIPHKQGAQSLKLTNIHNLTWFEVNHKKKRKYVVVKIMRDGLAANKETKTSLFIMDPTKEKIQLSTRCDYTYLP